MSFRPKIEGKFPKFISLNRIIPTIFVIFHLYGSYLGYHNMKHAFVENRPTLLLRYVTQSCIRIKLYKNVTHESAHFVLCCTHS